ncbi:hypothetical protein [Gemella cuniculi]|uniref:hypothetical protein n=1 Tax=Gemella cuniculi TaxID=150240 RepID=UPI00040BCA79|nr:hypothetical protein [Gemella cuniculi]
MYIEKLDKIITLSDVEKHIELLENDIVYFGGSLIEGKLNKNSIGMGNIYSDLDMFVIRDEEKFSETESTYKNKFKKTTFIRVNGMSIDVEIFNYEYIRKLIDELNSVKLDLNIRMDNVLNIDLTLQEINTFLCRLKYSINIKNKNKYDDLLKTIDFNNFLKIYKESLYNSWDNKLDDTLGNLKEKQYNVALHCCRIMFIEFSKHYLAEHSELIDRDKWIFLKAINTANTLKDKEFELKYNELFCSDVSDDEDKEKIIKRSLNFMKKKMDEFTLSDLI